MGKNNKARVIEHTEEDEDQIEENIDSALQCFDKIEELLGNVPDKRKTEYKDWKAKVNDIIEKCNKLTGSRIYNKIK